MATITATTTNVSSPVVPCYSCHQAVVLADAQPVQLLTPTSRYHAGVAVLGANETVYACNDCLTAETEQVSHIYTVSTCGTTKTVGAATPEIAAALMLQDRGWRSTRSIAVLVDNTWTEFLDCELVNGALQFAEQVQLP